MISCCCFYRRVAEHKTQSGLKKTVADLQVFSSVCFVVSFLRLLLFYTNIVTKDVLSLLRILAPRGTAMLLRPLPIKSRKKGLLVTCLILSPRIPALNMTSLMHKAAGSTRGRVFWRL